MQRIFRTEDGYTFYEQPDGTLTDTQRAEDADLVYANLGALSDDPFGVEEITANVYSYFVAKMGIGHTDHRWADFPMDSECGRICQQIIDAAAAWQSLCNPSTHDAVATAAFQAVGVVCFG